LLYDSTAASHLPKNNLSHILHRFCEQRLFDSSRFAGTNPQHPTTTQSDWYTIYFTDPSNSIASSYRGGIDENLAAAIDQARVSVDVAIYDLNLWSIRDALIRAHRREQRCGW